MKILQVVMCWMGKHPRQSIAWKAAVGGRNVEYCRACGKVTRQEKVTLSEAKRGRRRW